MLIANSKATRTSYPSQLRDVMSVAHAEESRKWISGWDGVNRGATPLFDLQDMAEKLGVAKVYVKDEAARSVLGSFKALGAPIALVRLIMRLYAEKNMDPVAMFGGAYKSELKDFTVISATDGNHGKGLAAAAKSIGCRCVIVLHANVVLEREEAIAAYGAEIIRIKGNYDESVAEAARLASENNWYVVSDTSYEGYEEIPRDVMQGYGTVAAEIVEAFKNSEVEGTPFTHVFLQGGVGGMAAGILSYLWEIYGAKRPTVVVVEPAQADCLYQSAIHGKPSNATGSVDSLMAGLACGETSPLAWRFLETAADYFMLITDDDAVVAMKLLATGSARDCPIVAGESGAAGFAGVVVLKSNRELSEKVGLDKNARVLVVNTEGATAPAGYRQLVGESARSVETRQKSWASKKAA